jgi:dienelactone hydrolase
LSHSRLFAADPALLKANQNQNRTRRDFIKLASTALLASGISGCCDFTPSVSTPLFYGYQTFGRAQGAALNMNVFYPTQDGSPQNAAFYSGCGNYPVIIFLHGNGTSYRTWVDLPGTLARAGFVVVVPDTQLGVDQVVGDCINAVSFLFRSSTFSKYLAHTIGLCGHSLGGGAAMQVAIGLSARACAALSPDINGWFNLGPPYSQLTMPLLIEWGDGEVYDPVATEQFDLSIPREAAAWNMFNRPKHLVVVVGGHHFDYVPPGSLDLFTDGIQRGPCTLTPLITTDFVVSFFSKYMKPAYVAIPDTLIPPPYTPTPSQGFYDGLFLEAFRYFQPNQHHQKGDPCWFTQHWETNNTVKPIGDIGLG